MAFKKIPLTIDTMIRNPVPVEGVNQEDNVELNIVVTENKTPKDLSSQAIKVYIRRIDGTLVEQTDQITPTNASKGEVTVKLKNSAFNKEGYALFQLDISDSSGRITSSYTTFKIGKGLVSGEAIANTNEIEALKKVEEYIKKANQELETFKQTVAEINENEATRQENEVVRVNEEASRNEAEAIRAQQEATRKEKENERVQAEIKRIADEEMRRENEVLRGSKELERKQAEELRKETELLRIEDENNRKVAESKRIEAESVRVEAEKLRVSAETGRVEAENLRVTAEEGRVAAETKREEVFNKFDGKINANTEELKAARTATTGEEFNSLDERIDCEVDRLNKKIEVSFLQQEDKENNVIENTVDGMTTDMIIKGRTLQNLVINKLDNTFVGDTTQKVILGYNNLFQNSKTYTIFYTVNEIIKGTQKTILNLGSGATGPDIVLTDSMKIGAHKQVFTLSSQPSSENTVVSLYHFVNQDNISEKKISNVIILNGDYSNIETPFFFENIKSFGQQEEKISTLSSSKNLFDTSKFEDNTIYYQDTGVKGHLNQYKAIRIKTTPNKSYFFTNPNSGTTVQCVAYKNGVRVSGGYNWRGLLTKDCDEYVFSFLKTEILSNDFQFEEGSQVTSYEHYKEDKKDILLQDLGFDEGLRGINGVSDELNSIRNVAIKRIGKREYREGDLLLDNVITDKVNTYYVLEEPVETPLNENINLKTFGERTYISFENAISGTSSFKAPVNTVATIARLNRKNRALKEENKNLRQDFESTTLSLTDSDLELVKQNVDIDFRLMEVEFALDIPQSTLCSNINFKKKGEVKSMARTPYEMMKIVILSGDYEREDYIHKVGKYYERRRMTKEEHDELMSLMTADEVIGG